MTMPETIATPSRNPARGLGAPRHPFGAVRLAGMRDAPERTPATHPCATVSANTLDNSPQQQPKVSTFDRDLTSSFSIFHFPSPRSPSPIPSF